MLFLSYRCFADSLPIVSPSWSLFQFFPLIVSSRRQQKSKEIPNACCCSRWILRLLLNEARAEEIAGIAGRTELSAFPHTGDAITFRPHAANACGGETCETLPPSEELRWFNGAGQKPAESLSIRRIKTPRSHFRNHFRSGGSKALQNHFRSGGSRALRNHFRSGGSNACRATFDPADQKPAESLWIRRIKSLRGPLSIRRIKTPRSPRSHFRSGGSKACGITFDPADPKSVEAAGCGQTDKRRGEGYLWKGESDRRLPYRTSRKDLATEPRLSISSPNRRTRSSLRVPLAAHSV